MFNPEILTIIGPKPIPVYLMEPSLIWDGISHDLSGAYFIIIAMLQGRIACANVLSDLYAMGVTECDNMLMLLGVSNKMSEKVKESCHN